MKKRYIWIIFALTFAIIAPLTTMNILDTFVFVRAKGKIDEDKEDFDFVTPTPENTENIYDKTTVEYDAGTRLINGYNVPYHALDIKLKSLSNLRSRLAVDSNGNYGVNIQQNMQTMVDEAKEATGKNVLGAITGDFCFWSDNRKGHVVRNGVVYRNSVKSKNSVDLVIKKDNSVELIKEGNYSPDVPVGEVSPTYYQVVSFGPVLVEDGKIKVEEDAEINGNTWTNNQRTAIGVIDWNHYIFLTTSALNRSSKELQSFKLHELALFFQERGCKYAYNLDGGYSSGFAYNNEVTFAPSRKVGDIFYVIDD